MSVASLLFTRVQAAEFYSGFLADALRLLPPGGGRRFLDVGCGPGKLTRLAAANGYVATGIDADAAMIASARRLALAEGSRAVFERRDVSATPLPSADLVAASSLLVVVPDARATLAALWSALAPGGTLLVIEATPRLTAKRADALVRRGELGRAGRLLSVWARARQGSTLDPSILDGLDDAEEVRTKELLDGMVGVWLARRFHKA